MIANLLPAARLIRIADLAGTFVFAIEGALAGMAAGFDPIGVLALAFVTALGGGVIRDVLIGSSPPAAMRDWRYAAIVLAAAALAWVAHPGGPALQRALLWLDGAGLALFAVAGTEKSLLGGIHPLPAMFLGAISGVGGGTIRDVLLNQVPRVLHEDVYATAALLAAAIVALGRGARLPAASVAIIAGLACFALRLVAVMLQWQLPKPG
jgi:uncharacterized membrane protein YeiH